MDRERSRGHRAALFDTAFSILMVRRLLSLTLAALMLAGAIDTPALGQDAIPSQAFRGITHRIFVSIEFDPGSPLRSASPSSAATLTAQLRIWDHARDSNFFGIALATFAQVRVREVVPAKLVWQDAGCHQDRGSPKVTVTTLNGLIEGDQGQITVSARPRHLGQRLPADELVPEQAFLLGEDRIGRFAIERAVTRRSRIHVEVKLYSIVCSLVAK